MRHIFFCFEEEAAAANTAAVRNSIRRQRKRRDNLCYGTCLHLYFWLARYIYIYIYTITKNGTGISLSFFLCNRLYFFGGWKAIMCDVLGACGNPAFMQPQSFNHRRRVYEWMNGCRRRRKRGRLLHRKLGLVVSERFVFTGVVLCVCFWVYQCK